MISVDTTRSNGSCCSLRYEGHFFSLCSSSSSSSTCTTIDFSRVFFSEHPWTYLGKSRTVERATTHKVGESRRSFKSKHQDQRGEGSIDRVVYLLSYVINYFLFLFFFFFSFFLQSTSISRKEYEERPLFPALEVTVPAAAKTIQFIHQVLFLQDSKSQHPGLCRTN